MWSPPSITRMTDRREREAERLRKSKTLTCDCCCKEFPTKSEGRYVEEYFSPLIADKASGILTICPKCAAENADKYGNPFGQEGEESNYFTCVDCGKLQQYSHSWAVFATVDEDGYHCMACAAKKYLAADSDKWLDSADDILRATASPEAVNAYGPKSLGCLAEDPKNKHPYGVVSFRATEEYETEGFDFFNKMQLGFPDGHDPVKDVRDCLLTAFRFYAKVAFCIGEVGQFQAYGDVLVDPSSRRKKARKPFNGDAVAAKAARCIPAGSFADLTPKRET